MPTTTLNIEAIQQINLFTKITGVGAENCFLYGNTIIFVVNPNSFGRALGKNGENLRHLSIALKKRVRIIKLPDKDLEKFIKFVVHPLKFKKLDEKDGLVTITAGPQSKAALIGRDKSKVIQLSNIVKQYFDIKGIRIV